MGYILRTEIMKEKNRTFVANKEEIAKQFGKVFKELLNPHTHTHTQQSYSLIEYYQQNPKT